MPSKKNKPRQKLLINPEELGVTDKIRRAFLDQPFGITTRLRRAMQGARDPRSFFYIKKNHVIVILLLALVGYILFFQKRDVEVAVVDEHGQEYITGTVPMSFLATRVVLKKTPVVNVRYEGLGAYGNRIDLADAIRVYKNGQEVADKYRLTPGRYEYKVKYKNYKIHATFNVGTSQNVIIRLEGTQPTATDLCQVTFLIKDKLRPGHQIFPDDVRVIEEGKWRSVRSGKIAPGQYLVEVSKAGYQPRSKTINVTSSGEVFSFELEPLQRPVKFQIDQFPELSLDPQEIELVATNTQRPVSFDGHALQPGKYEIIVKKEAFQDYRKIIEIPAGVDLYTIKLALKAKPRPLIIHPSYDIPPSVIQPDQIILKRVSDMHTLVLNKGTKVVPGRYILQVRKKGYMDFNEEVTIPPGQDPFEVKVTFSSDSQRLSLRITSDFPVNPYVVPEELKARFEVRKRGYFPVDTDIRALNPTAKHQEIPIELTTIPRKVVALITSDVEHGNIKPDVITLRSLGEGLKEPLSIDGKRKFKPDKYLLVIQKKGYNTLQEEIIIYPDEDDFVIEKQLTALDRKLEFEIDSDYRPGIWITPDAVVLNGADMDLNKAVHPGSYALSLKKAGYHVLDITVDIPPGVEPYKVKGRFLAKPRRVLFDVKDQKDKTLDGYEVTMGENICRHGDRVHPGNYNVTIKKMGYDQWDKDITIEPAEEDYLLKAVLYAKGRPVDLKVTASFPPGTILTPDKSFLNQRMITATATFKPGPYTLVIAKAGYKPINEKLTIGPGEEPFPIHRIMTPEPREVRLDLSVDVEPQDNTSRFQVSLTPVTGGGSIVVTEGSQVMPADYRLLVKRLGYKEHRASIRILPAIEPYYIKARLTALLRRVQVLVTSDYPKPETHITPEKVMLGQYDLRNPRKILPGEYELKIVANGYQPIEESIQIPAGVDTYKIIRRLSYKDRLVTYEIRDQESKELLEPKSVTLDGVEVTGTTRFQPKIGYQLKIDVPGYNPLQERMDLPPGDDTYVIKRELGSAFRLVVYKIDSDFEPGKPLTPDIISLNAQTVDGHRTFRPGTYDLVIALAGYQRVTDKETIASGRRPHEIRRTLVAKKRKLLLDIQGDFPPGVKIDPDKILFGAEEVKEGSLIKPGRYNVLIQKEGFEENSQTIVVEPSEKPFLLKARLTSRPRQIKFEITGDFEPGQPLIPDSLTIGGKPVRDGSLLRPGQYSISIAKLGYSTAQFTEEILPGDTPHIIKRELVAVPREVNVKVTIDYPKGTVLEKPDILTIDGRELEGTTFKPKRGYKLVIFHPGYQRLAETLDILPGEGPVKLERELVGLPRRLRLKIHYDIEPTPELGPYTVSLSDRLTRRRRKVKNGDLIHPGEYSLRIEKEAYETLEETLRVYASPKPLVIEKTLISKPVLLRIKVIYDVKPPANLPPYKVTLIDNLGIPRAVDDGRRIKPGFYTQEIKRPGYEMEHKGKKINIKPSEKPFFIEGHLLAKSRRISFDMRHKGVQIDAYQILVNGKTVGSNDVFEPGKTYEAVAKFKKFETVRKQTYIPPGEGPHLVKFDMIELKKYENIKIVGVHDGGEIDGISYPLQIFADGKEVEKHHIQKDGFGSTLFIAIYAPANMTTIRICWGFYYDEKNIADLYKFRKLERIDIERLIEHLKSVGPNVALKRLEKITSKRYIKHLRATGRRYLDKLIRYVDEEIIPGGHREANRKNSILKKLREVR